MEDPSFVKTLEGKTEEGGKKAGDGAWFLIAGINEKNNKEEKKKDDKRNFVFGQHGLKTQKLKVKGQKFVSAKIRANKQKLRLKSVCEKLDEKSRGMILQTLDGTLQLPFIVYESLQNVSQPRQKRGYKRQ